MRQFFFNFPIWDAPDSLLKHMKWNRRGGGGSLSEKSKFLTFQATAHFDLFLDCKLLFSLKKYLSSTQTWTSFKCPFSRKNFLTDQLCTESDEAPNEWSRPLPMRSSDRTISFDYFFFHFLLFELSQSYISDQQTRDAKRFPSILSLFIQLKLQGEGPLNNGHAINLSF